MSVAATAFMVANGRFKGVAIVDGFGLVTDNQAISTDGNGNMAINGNMFFNTFKTTATTSAQALSNGSTISLSGQTILLVSAAAAVTGIILPVPTTTNDQFIVVINISAAANTITFAASGTSHVADGASDVITGPAAAWYVWDVTETLWYRIKG